MKFTEKQKELIRDFKSQKLKRINILQGSIRSGKTWISLVLWAFYVASSAEDKSYLMTAKTLTSLKRNCLDLLEQLVGRENFNYSISQKQGILFGRRIHLEGVNDTRSESKIRGMTLQGAYCDELTLFTEDFFAMLLTRLSENGAKLIATTNPDNPNHWLKVNYLDRKDTIDIYSKQFLIDDNTTLSPEFITNTKKENQGVFYERFILGKWVNAEGLIYPLIADNFKKFMIEREDVPRLSNVCVGEDFGGNKSGHAIVCSGIGRDNILYFMSADFRSAKGTTTEEVIKWSLWTYEEIYKDVGVMFDIFPDSAEQMMINSLRERSSFPIYNSLKRPIIDRIRFLNILLATDRVRFVKGKTEKLVKALSEAMWDDKKMEDTRLDNGTFNNDIIDAAEYSFEYNMNDMVVNYNVDS